MTPSTSAYQRAQCVTSRECSSGPRTTSQTPGARCSYRETPERLPDAVRTHLDNLMQKCRRTRARRNTVAVAAPVAQRGHRLGMKRCARRAGPELLVRQLRET